MPFPELTAYFTAEKQGGLLLSRSPSPALRSPPTCSRRRASFSAMAWPILVLGGLELVIGVTVAGRAGSQVAELEAGLQATRAQTVTARWSGWRVSTARSS